MPFSFRDRLGSSSKQERDLLQQHVPPSTTHSGDGNSSSSKITSRSSTGDPSSSSISAAAVHALKSQPISADPGQFVQDALTPLYTFNAKHDTVTLDDVLEHHVPRYFSPHFKHSFNLNDADIHSELLALVNDDGSRPVTRLVATEKKHVPAFATGRIRYAGKWQKLTQGYPQLHRLD